MAIRTLSTDLMPSGMQNRRIVYPAGRRDPELLICIVLRYYQNLSTLYSTKPARKFQQFILASDFGTTIKFYKTTNFFVDKYEVIRIVLLI
jgi:hypothetical protein